MGRDILSEFGEDSPHPQAPRAMSGGVTKAKDLPYCPPMGPKPINYERPGLGGGVNYGSCGTQGRHDEPAETSGGPGLDGGKNHGHGTQR